MQGALVGEVFGSEYSHVPKTFEDIATIEEFWQFCKGPLINTIAKHGLMEVDGVDVKRDPHQHYSVMRQNRLVGAMRFRQKRVKVGNSSMSASRHRTAL